MSRCFPYPPPGYAPSRATNEALIESIKLQNEMTKSKKEHKERDKTKDKEQRKKDKKEKKERRKEKKDKKDKIQQSLHKSDGVLGNIGEKSWANTNSDILHKGCEVESEQLERSIVTEEHGHAIGSNALSYSSDSTENSNKRKRQFSPADVNRTHGKIIRIKLSKKTNNSGTAAYEQQLCSTSGRAYLPSQHSEDAGVAHRKESTCSMSNRPGKSSQGFNEGKIHVMSQQIKTTPIENPQVPSPKSTVMIPPTSKQIKTTPIGKTAIPPPKSIVLTPMQKMELHYNDLFEKLAPTPMHDASLPDDDLGWLFNTKKQDRNTELKPTSGIASVSYSSNTTMWPRAHYLQEVDIYALPFTVPF